MKSEVKKSVAVGGLKPPTRDTFLTGFTIPIEPGILITLAGRFSSTSFIHNAYGTTDKTLYVIKKEEVVNESHLQDISLFEKQKS